jgi:hypothetical protein
VTAFGMLHHLPSPEHQDQIFAEMKLVIRPSGSFTGTDGFDDERTQLAHIGDFFVPIEPGPFPSGWRRSDSSISMSKSANATCAFTPDAPVTDLGCRLPSSEALIGPSTST